MMIRRAAISDPVLDDMITSIVARVQPTRIMLFGSRARGDARPDSDYDLMVEVEYADHHTCWSELYRAAKQRREGAPVDIILRAPGELERRQDDVGYLDWKIAREGVVVYPPGAPARLAVSSVPRPRRVSEGPPRSVADWLARAAEDLRIIEPGAVAPPIPWSTIAFHSRQAAEKYLKVLLVCANVPPPRTHDLAELVMAARSAGYDLPDLRAECESLKDYAVMVRYPEQVPIPDETKGLAALEAGRRIVAAVREHLRRLGIPWPVMGGRDEGRADE